MNITLTFTADGTEAEVYSAINSYGVAIQDMKANISDGANKVTVTAKAPKDIDEVEDGDIAIPVETETPKELETPEKPKKAAKKKATLPTAEKKEEPKSAVTLEDIHKLGASLMSEHQAELEEVIANFGINSLTELPEEKYQDMYDALKQIGG